MGTNDVPALSSCGSRVHNGPMAAHDPSYKFLFSHREMVADLVRGFVREDWVAALDFDTLERVR